MKVVRPPSEPDSLDTVVASRSRAVQLGVADSGLFEQALPLPFIAKSGTPRGVHVEEAERRATRENKRENVSALNGKVFSPTRPHAG